jgi:hypothetical protein
LNGGIFEKQKTSLWKRLSRRDRKPPLSSSGDGNSACDSEGNHDNRHRGSDQWLYVASETGAAIINGKRCALGPGTLMLIEHKDKHEIRNTGRALLRTLNFYIPPSYTKSGDELPPAKP